MSRHWNFNILTKSLVAEHLKGGVVVRWYAVYYVGAVYYNNAVFYLRLVQPVPWAESGAATSWLPSIVILNAELIDAVPSVILFLQFLT